MVWRSKVSWAKHPKRTYTGRKKVSKKVTKRTTYISGGLKPYKRNINNITMRRCFTIQRDIFTGQPDAGNISISSYTSSLPQNGACYFNLSDIPATEIASFINIFQEAALYQVYAKFYPQTTNNPGPISQDIGGTGNFTWYRRDPSYFAVDQQDAELESENDIMNHGVKRVYSHNQHKPMTMKIIPRTRDIISSGPSGVSTTLGVVNNKLQWFSTHLGTPGLSCPQYGFKWKINSGVVVDNGGTPDTYFGKMVIKYYVAFRKSKLDSL